MLGGDSSQTRHWTGVLLTEGAGQATEVKSAPTWPAGGTVSVPGGVFVTLRVNKSQKNDF